MTTRSLLILCSAAVPLHALAVEAGAAPAAPAPPPPPAAYAVLKAPLPPDLAILCKAEPVDAKTLRVGLFSAAAATCPAARAGDEVVTVGELAETLAMAHETGAQGIGAAQAKAGLGSDLDHALGRLVDIRLIVQEAEEMELLDQPETKAALAEWEADLLRATLERRAVEGAQPDPAEVKGFYREAVKEWQLRSVQFKKEQDAVAFRARVVKGEKFEKAVAKAVADQLAEGSADADWVRVDALVPKIAVAVGPLKPGSITPVLAVGKGFVVARLEGVRYPEGDAAVLEKARQASLARQRFIALGRYYDGLVKKHARVDRALLAKLDLEAKKPGFQALRKDPRVLARVDGSDPVTVGDLTNAVGKKFFHGIERPIQEHRVNAAIRPEFEDLIRVRVAKREIEVLKLADAPEHQRAVTEHRREVAFATFIEKVLLPGIQVSEKETQQSYEEHRKELTSPQMYKLEGLGFGSAKQAQAAVEQLRAGTDLAWLRANAEGQLPAEGTRLILDGQTVSASTMPAGLVKALAGARKGDLRLYSDEPQHYAIRVVEDIAPQVRPYAEVRESLAKKLFADKLTKAVHDYAEALRKARPVEVFIARIEN